MFFIMGSPRSGTTMLQQILDGSPNLIVPLESYFIVSHKRKYFNLEIWTSEKVDEFIDELADDTKFTLAWEMNIDQLRTDCHKIPLAELSFELLCKIVYLHFPSFNNKGEIRFLGDKNPDNAMHLDLIHEVFPHAKIIHMVRDYRANIVSNRKWFPRKNIFMLAHKWRLYNLYIEKLKRKKTNPFYTIRYEDLVEQPEKYSKEICQFIGIEFLPEMVNYQQSLKKKYLEDEESRKRFEFQTRILNTLHENLTKPINSNKVDAWKQELSPKQLRAADYVAGNFARNYGYHKTNNTRNPALFFLSLLAELRFRKDVFIIRVYHDLPVWTRPIFRFISEKLYDWFGIVHIYNTKYSRKKENTNQAK